MVTARYSSVWGLENQAAVVLRASNVLDREGEEIADPALGSNDAWRARVCFQLAPQSQDLHIDATVENILMHAG